MASKRGRDELEAEDYDQNLKEAIELSLQSNAKRTKYTRTEDIVTVNDSDEDDEELQAALKASLNYVTKPLVGT